MTLDEFLAGFDLYAEDMVGKTIFIRVSRGMLAQERRRLVRGVSEYGVDGTVQQGLRHILRMKQEEICDLLGYDYMERLVRGEILVGPKEGRWRRTQRTLLQPIQKLLSAAGAYLRGERGMPARSVGRRYDGKADAGCAPTAE